MKKIFTSLLVVLACCTAIIAAVQTELRMHIFQEGDKGESFYVVSRVDSVKFTLDTLEFRVSFVDWNGTELQSGILQSGATPKYEGKEPTREQTAKYTYDFKGWNPEIAEVQKEAVYTAEYDSTLRQYEVVFKSQSGEVLSATSYDYGSLPVYDGVVPFKESTKLYDFTPVWKPALTEVSGEATYTVDFDSTKHVYTCIFNDYDGNELEKEENTYDYELSEQPTRSEGPDYAYTFKEWSLDESRIEDNILVYTAVYDSLKHGKLNYASFKVSDTKSVYFSQGNLQFNAAQGTHAVYEGTEEIVGTWRFAENQYDYVGKANSNMSESYDGWIDLFGWGTSGWSSGATAYQPWSTSTVDSDYYPGESSSNDMTGNYAKADWGVYNAISNGGGEPNKWRTLTTSEWQYLFKNNKWTLGYVKDGDDSHLCFMLIPEGFVAPSGVEITVISTSLSLSDGYVSFTESGYAGNTYTTEQFASLEKLGVVVLPCGGERDGTTVNYVGSGGCYWSSSAYSSYDAYVFSFYPASVSSDYYGDGRYYGRSVRLVQDL